MSIFIHLLIFTLGKPFGPVAVSGWIQENENNAKNQWFSEFPES